jgi:hypothetical protein
MKYEELIKTLYRLSDDLYNEHIEIKNNVVLTLKKEDFEMVDEKVFYDINGEDTHKKFISSEKEINITFANLDVTINKAD